MQRFVNLVDSFYVGRLLLLCVPAPFKVNFIVNEILSRTYLVLRRITCQVFKRVPQIISEFLFFVEKELCSFLVRLAVIEFYALKASESSRCAIRKDFTEREAPQAAQAVAAWFMVFVKVLAERLSCGLIAGLVVVMSGKGGDTRIPSKRALAA